MLRKKALRKIFITTLTAFILMTIYFLPTKKEEVLPTNLEIEYLSGLGTNNIYLLSSNDHLVKSKILLDNKIVEKNCLKILNTLKEENKELMPNGLNGIIPKNTKVNSIKLNNDTLEIDFSKELYNISKKLSKKMIEAIVFSITDIKDINKVIITVENNVLDKYPNTDLNLQMPLTKNIGINKEVNISNRNNIEKVVVYYVEEIEKNNYYVPVTKYINSKDDKIKVIIDELSTAYIYEPNLMSFLNNSTKLKNYDESDDTLILNFNDGIFDNNNKILEEVLYTISYSVFDNYEVEKIVFKVDDKKVKELTNKDLP